MPWTLGGQTVSLGMVTPEMGMVSTVVDTWLSLHPDTDIWIRMKDPTNPARTVTIQKNLINAC